MSFRLGLPTGLTFGRGRKSAPAAPPAKLPVGTFVEFIGDNIIQFSHINGGNWADSQGNGYPLYSQGRGEMIWARALFPSFRTDTWPSTDGRPNSDLNPSNPTIRRFSGMNQGFQGDKVSNLLTRRTQQAPSSASMSGIGVSVLAISANDILAAAADPTTAIMAAIDAEVQYRKSRNRKVIIGNVMPWKIGHNADSAARRSWRVAVNAAIATYCTANNIPLWDRSAAIKDPSTEYGLSTAFIDTLNINDYGALLSALKLEVILRAMIDDGLWHSGLRAGNLISVADRYFNAGTAGSKSGNVAAGSVIPTGYTISGPTNSQIASQLVANPETGGNILRLAITPGGTANEQPGITLARTYNPAFGYYMAYARVKLDANCDWIGGHVLQINKVSSSRTLSSGMQKTVDSVVNAGRGAKEIYIFTPIFYYDNPEGTTTGIRPSIQLQLTPNGQSNVATIDFIELGIVPMDDFKTQLAA